MFDYETFRLKLILNRRNLKMTQDELSKITGLDEKNISKIETGTHPPRLRTVVAILNAFNTSFSSFMGETEDEKIIIIENINKYLMDLTLKDRNIILEFIKELNKEIE